MSEYSEREQMLKDENDKLRDSIVKLKSVIDDQNKELPRMQLRQWDKIREFRLEIQKLTESLLLIKSENKKIRNCLEGIAFLPKEAREFLRELREEK